MTNWLAFDAVVIAPSATSEVAFRARPEKGMKGPASTFQVSAAVVWSCCDDQRADGVAGYRMKGILA